jgi:hypothetical protein
MCIIDVFPCSPLSLFVVYGDYMNSWCFPLPSHCCCLLYREEEDVLVFDIIIFFITIISSEQAHKNPFNTFFYLQCVILCWKPLSLFVCCPCHVFPIIVTCYVWFYAHQCVPLVLHHQCLLHVVVRWIVNVLVFELNKLTPHPNTFFITMCDFLLPIVFFFLLHVMITIFPIVTTCCIVAQGRKGGSNVQVHLFHQYFL